MSSQITGAMIPRGTSTGLPISGDLVVFRTPERGTLWDRVADDDWEGHPNVPVSDAELQRLIAEDAGFGTNPLAALHGITSSVEGLEK